MEFFKDESGRLSSTRLVFVVWSLGMFVVWAAVSVKGWKLADIPWECLTIIGMLMTGKVAQKFKEKLKQ